MFGVEAILLIKFKIPSLRIAIDEKMNDTGSLRECLEQLEALSK